MGCHAILAVIVGLGGMLRRYQFRKRLREILRDTFLNLGGLAVVEG